MTHKLWNISRGCLVCRWQVSLKVNQIPFLPAHPIPPVQYFKSSRLPTATKSIPNPSHQRLIHLLIVRRLIHKFKRKWKNKILNLAGHKLSLKTPTRLKKFSQVLIPVPRIYLVLRGLKLGIRWKSETRKNNKKVFWICWTFLYSIEYPIFYQITFIITAIVYFTGHFDF